MSECRNGQLSLIHACRQRGPKKQWPLELMVIRPLAYFLKLAFRAKEPAPGLTRRKVVQGVEEVLLSTPASLKTALPLGLPLLG